MRRVVLGTVLLIACNARPEPGDDEAADEGISTTDEDEFGSGEVSDFPLSCHPSACTQSCWDEYDQCGHTSQGTCSEQDICVCEQVEECLPCAGQVCDNYEVCGSFGREGEYGSCHLPCSYTLDYEWDPELGCTIALPEDYPTQSLDWFFLEVAGMSFPRVDGCGDPAEPDAYVLDERTLIITLCGEACSRFETEGWLETGWGIPCP